MSNIVYPAFFIQEENGYVVSFPDLPGCITEGSSITHAYTMAREALGLYVDCESNLPNASDVHKLKSPTNGYIMLVDADTKTPIEYFSKTNNTKVLRDALQSAGYSQYKVAKILDISESYISKIVSGKRSPSPEVAQRLGELLNFDWRIFFLQSTAN